MFAQAHLFNRALLFFSDCTWPDVVVQWCSQGDLLAVAGMERTLLATDSSCPPMTRNAIVKFYNVRGEHIYTLDTPAQVPNTVAATTLCVAKSWKTSVTSQKSQPLTLQIRFDSIRLNFNDLKLGNYTIDVVKPFSHWLVHGLSENLCRVSSHLWNFSHVDLFCFAACCL